MLQEISNTDPARRSEKAGSLCALHLGDAAELEDVFGPRAEAVQLSTGPFSADLLQLRLNAVSVRSCIASGGFQLRRTVGEDQISVAFLNHAEDILENGHPWSSGQLLVVNGRDIDMSVLGDSHITWIEIDLPFAAHDDLRTLLSKARGRSVLVSPPERAFDALRSYTMTALKMCSASEMHRVVESNILRHVESVIPASDDCAIELGRKRKAFSLVRQVEQFMWDNVEETLTLERICASTNCRARSLIYSFKEWFGVGPITYLKILRLNAVHRRLKETRGDVRIFDVATDFGFWHMGHFSTNYKRMFGVTPTQTIWAARSRTGGRSSKEDAL
jgi:AraC family ethanolamine operon transcriptional activator